MNADDFYRMELIKKRLKVSKATPPIAISSVYYIEDVGFLLAFIEKDAFDPVCRKCGDILTTYELICENCHKTIKEFPEGMGGANGT